MLTGYPITGTPIAGASQSESFADFDCVARHAAVESFRATAYANGMAAATHGSGGFATVNSLGAIFLASVGQSANRLQTSAISNLHLAAFGGDASQGIASRVVGFSGMASGDSLAWIRLASMNPTPIYGRIKIARESAALRVNGESHFIAINREINKTKIWEQVP